MLIIRTFHPSFVQMLTAVSPCGIVTFRIIKLPAALSGCQTPGELV